MEKISNSISDLNLNSQTLAEARSGYGDRRWKQAKRPYKKNAKPRWWKSRKDPFQLVWPTIVSWLEENPDQTAKDILQKLEEKHPGQFTMRNKRTLHRRLKPWKLERIFARSKAESSDGNLLRVTPISIYGTPSIGQVTTMAG